MQEGVPLMCHEDLDRLEMIHAYELDSSTLSKAGRTRLSLMSASVGFCLDLDHSDIVDLPIHGHDPPSADECTPN